MLVLLWLLMNRTRLGARGLEEEAAWIARRRQLWDARFDALDAIVEDMHRKEKASGRKKR